MVDWRVAWARGVARAGACASLAVLLPLTLVARNAAAQADAASAEPAENATEVPEGEGHAAAPREPPREPPTEPPTELPTQAQPAQPPKQISQPTTPPAPIVAQAQSTPAPAARRWYGWQPLIADALAVSTFAVGATRNSAPLALTGLGLYFVGAPTVHFIHRGTSGGLSSLALHVGLPLAAGVVGAVVSTAWFEHRGSPTYDDGESDLSAWLGLWAGIAVGTAAAMAIDASVIAWEPRAQAPQALKPPASRVAAAVVPARGGGRLVVGYSW